MKKHKKKETKTEATLVFDDERKDVWFKMSDLFLDTELTDEDISSMARALDKTSYSIPQIIEIFEDEVAPVLHINLQSLAGEWSGFTREQVEDLVTRRMEALRKQVKEPKFLKQAKTAIYLSMCKDDWESVLVELEDLRAKREQPEQSEQSSEAN